MNRGGEQEYMYGRDGTSTAREGGVSGGEGEGGSGGSGGGGRGVCGSPLLKAMLDNFRDPCLEKMLERLDSILTESTSYTKNLAAMRHEVCVCVCAS